MVREWGGYYAGMMRGWGGDAMVTVHCSPGALTEPIQAYSSKYTKPVTQYKQV